METLQKAVTLFKELLGSFVANKSDFYSLIVLISLMAALYISYDDKKANKKELVECQDKVENMYELRLKESKLYDEIQLLKSIKADTL